MDTYRGRVGFTSLLPRGYLSPGLLSFVSFHAPIDEAFLAIQEITKTKRGGNVYWLPNLKGRVARWDGVEVYPGINMNLWVFGSSIRGKNTVYARTGWWTLSILTEVLRARALK